MHHTIQTHQGWVGAISSEEVLPEFVSGQQVHARWVHIICRSAEVDRPVGCRAHDDGSQSDGLHFCTVHIKLLLSVIKLCICEATWHHGEWC